MEASHDFPRYLLEPVREVALSEKCLLEDREKINDGSKSSKILQICITSRTSVRRHDQAMSLG